MRFVAIYYLQLPSPKHMFVYYRYIILDIIYKLIPPVVQRQWRQSAGGPPRWQQQKCRAHNIIYYIILYNNVRVVHASIRHHVDLLKNSLYLVATIFGGVESR